MAAPSPQVESSRWNSQAPLVGGKVVAGAAAAVASSSSSSSSSSLPRIWLSDSHLRCDAGSKLNATVDRLESQALQVQF